MVVVVVVNYGLPTAKTKCASVLREKNKITVYQQQTALLAKCGLHKDMLGSPVWMFRDLADYVRYVLRSMTDVLDIQWYVEYIYYHGSRITEGM